MVGIAFSPIQWLIVCRIKLSPERPSNGGGFSDHLIEEEEGFNIQNAISEGGLYFMHSRMVGVGKINTRQSVETTQILLRIHFKPTSVHSQACWFVILRSPILSRWLADLIGLCLLNGERWLADLIGLCRLNGERHLKNSLYHCVMVQVQLNLHRRFHSLVTLVICCVVDIIVGIIMWKGVKSRATRPKEVGIEIEMEMRIPPLVGPRCTDASTGGADGDEGRDFV